MSVDAIRWAFLQQTGKSSAKAVLIALADRAGDEHLCWPSVERLCLDTELNRKTVISSIQHLIENGFIKDAGERRGSTGRVKVYQLLGVSDRERVRAIVNSSKNGTIKKHQIDSHKIGPKTEPLNSTENGTIPKTEPFNSPKNGTVNSPKNGTQNHHRTTSNLKHSCPVAPDDDANTAFEPVDDQPQKQARAQRIEAQACEAVDYLNAKAETRFKHSSASLRYAKARLNEGFTLDQLKAIVDFKTIQWGKDPRMREYLRPQTIWNGNAEAYLNAIETGVNPHAQSFGIAGQRPASAIERRLAEQAARNQFENNGSAVEQNDFDVRPSLDGEFWREDRP